MKLVEEFVATVYLNQPLEIGTGPIGTRRYFDIKGGQIVGDRINANILGGGDWALIGPDGFLRVDVRFQAETNDGALMYVQYVGLLGLNEAALSAEQNGTGTDFGDQYFHTNPRIETGAEQYAWLNTTFFIGEGRILPDPGVEYRVWRPA
jgi:Protein of unknown function (DUF3237)